MRILFLLALSFGTLFPPLAPVFGQGPAVVSHSSLSLIDPLVPPPASVPIVKVSRVEAILLSASWCNPCKFYKGHTIDPLLRGDPNWANYVFVVDVEGDDERKKFAKRDAKGEIQVPQIIIVKDGVCIMRYRVLPSSESLANAIHAVRDGD